MTKPTHFQNHAPSRKRVPSQPEAGFFHHINGVFAPETVASARIGGWTLICLKSAPVPKIITRVIKGVWGCPLFAGYFGLNDATILAVMM
jgi:hypothetical protein